MKPLQMLFFLGVSSLCFHNREAYAQPPELTQPQEEQLSTLLTQAKSKYEQGEFEASIELLNQAYTLYPTAAIQRRIGEIHVHRGAAKDAIKAYTLYLTILPNAPDRKRIEAAIQSLEKKDLGIATISSTPPRATVHLTSTPDSPVLGQTPLRVELPAGPHTFKIRRPGFHPTQVNLTVIASEETSHASTLMARTPKPQASNSPSATVWAIGGVGVLSAASSVTLMLLARDIDQELQAQELQRSERLRPANYNDDVTKHNRYQLSSYVTGGLAIGALSTAAILWMMEANESDRALNQGNLNVMVDPKTSHTELNWSLQF